ncbi:MAG: urocanate hydratase [Saprospiraceae bacterium]|nr:urocanate hydratase [Saprospiraceae bacterium]
MNHSRFLEEYATHPNYVAPTGAKLHAKSWQTEAPLRMLLNNLNAEVAENPDELIVYGGTGQAARNRESLVAIIKHLLELGDDQSLLIQSGKAVGVVRSHPEAPRVLIANSNLVPKWANWDHFNDLKKRGLMMFGQMTAGSWIYIGTQGILQGTYETFAACARTHFEGDLKGKLIVSGGLGGMGGAQPLAATMNNAVFLGVDVDPSRIQKRIDSRYCDRMTTSYAEAVKWIGDAVSTKKKLSVGLVGNIVDVLQKLIDDGITPDILTDQTSAHDPIYGYVPHGMSLGEARSVRSASPVKYKERSMKSMAIHVGHMLTLKEKGAVTFDYGNNLRAFALEGGESRAFDFPGFTPAYIRPLFCEGKGPFRWVALSGDPDDIYATDQALISEFPENEGLLRWLQRAREEISFQGLPARICWLGMGEREKAGILFNDLVRKGVVKAPIVIGRDHLDCGSVASPNRETEAMKDGSDAVADWPLLNLMANTSGGATWVSFHHGGGVGIGYSLHAGMVVLADGTERAAKCLHRVLYNDPALGVYRHVDAGYSEAEKTLHDYHLIK